MLKFPQFSSASSRRQFRLGLALSGGGARGFAHLGAIRALEDCGFRPDIVAGVSAGSVVAAFYSAGLSTERILAIFHQAKFRQFAEMKVPRDGLFRMDRFKRMVERETGVKKIEDLPLPTVICATDLDSGTPVAFTSGALGDRVAASCSIPIVFEPVVIDGRRYVDGGVLHNLPAWPLRDRCEKLIGINCSPMYPSAMPAGKGIIDVARRSFMMMTKGNVPQDMGRCDLAVELSEVADHQVFDLKDLELLVEHGYLTTIKAIRQNKFSL